MLLFSRPFREIHHLACQWSDKDTTQLKLQNEYKQGCGRPRGDEKYKYSIQSIPNIAIIIRLIVLHSEVIATHASTPPIIYPVAPTTILFHLRVDLS